MAIAMAIEALIALWAARSEVAGLVLLAILRSWAFLVPQPWCREALAN